MTFSDPKIVVLLQNDFIPVAIDQWFERQQRDAEGDFFRKIAKQGPRGDINQTAQGRYICTPGGELLGFNNNRGPERVRKLMIKALATRDRKAVADAKPIATGTNDPKFNFRLPAGGLVVRVNSKVLSGHAPTDDWTKVFHDAIGRDNLWLTKEEQAGLAATIRNGGEVPPAITQRIARFHLVDNTRGEPPRWKRDEIKLMKIKINAEGEIHGQVKLETANGDRGFEAKILGRARAEGDQVIQFDMVAKGEFWGRGQWTGFEPKGKFPLAIAFRIADGKDPSDQIGPHAMKGSAGEYFE